MKKHREENNHRIFKLALTGIVLALLLGGFNSNGTSEARELGTDLSFFHTVGRDIVSDSTDEKVVFRGVNLNGLEFGVWENFEDNPCPGEEGTNYFRPREKDFENIKDSGFNVIRVPFEWARLVTGWKPSDPLPTELDMEYLGFLDDVVDMAGQNELYVILDMHDFLKYWCSKGDYKCVDDSDAYQQLLIRTWKLLAEHFSENTAVLGYDIMNEPVRQEEEENCSSCNWHAIAQSVVDAIRTVDENHLIFVEGPNYSLASDWPVENGKKPFINDAVTPPRIVYSPHVFFDFNSDSKYDQEGEDIDPIGIWEYYARDRLMPAIDWSIDNNVPIFIGETNVPCTADWALVLDHAFRNFFEPLNLSVTAWHYIDPQHCPLNECPLNLLACPEGYQLDVLKKYPGGVYQEREPFTPTPYDSLIYGDERVNPWDCGDGYWGDIIIDFCNKNPAFEGNCSISVHFYREWEYLFSIEKEFEDELNKGIISEKLRDIFKTNGFPLSENAMVTKEKDDKWVITDGEKIYIVKKEDGKLNIYYRDNYSGVKFMHHYGLDTRRFNILRFQIFLSGEGEQNFKIFTTAPRSDCDPGEDPIYPSTFDEQPELIEFFPSPRVSGWQQVDIPLEAIVNPEEPIINGIAFQNMGKSQEVFYLDGIELINDTTPPIITNVTVTNITDNSATIKWDTDEVADSFVKYGKTSGIYTESEGDPLFVKNHTIELTGLLPGTCCYFVVNSTDQSGNSNESIEYNFNTTGELKVSVTKAIDPVTPGGYSQVTVHVSTTEGTPVSDAIVSVSATGGSLSPTSGTTNPKGEFKSIYNAPNVTTTQTYIISATASKAGYISGSGSDTITVKTLPQSETAIIPSWENPQVKIENHANRDVTVTFTGHTSAIIYLKSGATESRRFAPGEYSIRATAPGASPATIRATLSKGYMYILRIFEIRVGYP